jgi:hypothetical protein
MSKLTFRPQALEKLASPEQLDQLIRITTLKNWLALVGLTCLLVPLLVWGLWGSLETRSHVQGLLLPSGGLCVATAPQIGQIGAVYVGPGQEIRVGQALASTQSTGPGSLPEDIPSPCSGKVVSATVRAGDWVERGMALLIIEPSGQPLEVVTYIGLEEARNIVPGMAVLISPSGFQAEVNGYLMGTIRSVGQYPIDPQALIRQVGSQSLAQTFLQGGARVEVHVSLLSAPGGYQWSLNRQPAQPLSSGTLCSVSILLERQAPLALIFPGVGR